MSVRITDTLTGDGRKFQKMLRELASLEVHVGFQHGEAVEDNRADVCDVAAWNELGIENAPSRPFLRKSVDENEGKIRNFIHEAKDDLIHDMSVGRFLKNIGLFQKDLIQEKITEGDFVPNADITINGGWMRNKKTGKAFYVKGKKSSKPLIDTGKMCQSVNYQIKRKGS